MRNEDDYNRIVVYLWTKRFFISYETLSVHHRIADLLA